MRPDDLSGSAPEDSPESVLVLGAYGSAGRVIVDALLAAGIPVKAAGRNREKLQNLLSRGTSRKSRSQVEGALVDIDDTSRLCSALQGCAVVINAVGPYLQNGLKVARSAVAAGVHYLDIASEQAHFRNLETLGKEAAAKGLFLGTGYGLYPGISGLLASDLLSRLNQPLGFEIFLAMGKKPTGEGKAQILSGILEMTTDQEHFRKGKAQRVRPGKRVPVAFPHPFGIRPAMIWPQMELSDLVRDNQSVAEATSGIYVHGQRAPSALEVSLIRLLNPANHPALLRFFGKIASIRTKNPSRNDPSGAALLVRAWDAHHTVEERLRSEDIGAATAILPTYVAGRLIRKSVDGTRIPSGLVPPRAWIDLDAVKETLAKRSSTGSWNGLET